MSLTLFSEHPFICPKSKDGGDRHREGRLRQPLDNPEELQVDIVFVPFSKWMEKIEQPDLAFRGLEGGFESQGIFQVFPRGGKFADGEI